MSDVYFQLKHKPFSKQLKQSIIWKYSSIQNRLNFQNFQNSMNHENILIFLIICLHIILLNTESTEMGNFEWWISRLMLDPLFFLISRLKMLVLLLLLISRLIHRSGLRIFHSKVFSSELGTFEWYIWD